MRDGGAGGVATTETRDERAPDAAANTGSEVSDAELSDKELDGVAGGIFVSPVPTPGGSRKG